MGIKMKGHRAKLLKVDGSLYGDNKHSCSKDRIQELEAFLVRRSDITLWNK